jgi:hypothetical protein
LQKNAVRQVDTDVADQLPVDHLMALNGGVRIDW